MTTPEQFDPIEDALQTYPMAAPPSGLSRQILARIQPRQPIIRFGLTWLDIASGLLLSAFPLVLLLAWRLIPLELHLQLQFQWLLLQSAQLTPYLAAGLALGGLLIALMFAAALHVLLQPPLKRT